MGRLTLAAWLTELMWLNWPQLFPECSEASSQLLITVTGSWFHGKFNILGGGLGTNANPVWELAMMQH